MALPNDMSRTCDIMAGQQASDPTFSSDSNKRAAPRAMIRTTIMLTTPQTNANASNAVVANAAVCQRMLAAGRVLGAYWLSSAAITAAGGNNATIALYPLDGTGNTGGLIASQTTNTTANGGTGNFVAGQAATLTVVTANIRYTKGTWLAGQISQNSSGVAVPTGVLCVDVEQEDVDGYPV